ncbi:MAG: hypothetical protein M3Q56_05035 [Bacteroidota bacterium]|nr:hypothetical protein [Bacteroidota bacterium]
MSLDLVTSFYPMPSEYLRSMLFAETESLSKISFHQTTDKQIWICNKIIRNLLSQRKTLIVVNNRDEAAWIDEFLSEHGLRHVLFHFQHSRSENEKNLLSLRVNNSTGKLKQTTTDLIAQELEKLSIILNFHLGAYHNSLPQNSKSLIDCLFEFLSNSNNTTANSLFQESFKKIVTSEDYYFLKKNLKNLKELISGWLPKSHPFNSLSSNLFDLFLPDESWAYIEYYLTKWISKGTEILDYTQQLIQLENQYHKDQLKLHFEQIELELELKYYAYQNETSKESELILNHIIRKYLDDIINFFPENGDELKTIPDKSLIQKYQVCKVLLPQWIYNYSQVHITPIPISSSNSKIINVVYDDFRLWVKQINELNFFADPILIKHDELILLHNQLKELILNFKQILQSKDQFVSYFFWNKFAQSLSEIHIELIENLLPYEKAEWKNILDAYYYRQQIDLHLPGKQPDTANLLIQFKEKLLEYKNNIPILLESQYDQVQADHLQLYKITHPHLYNVIHSKQENLLQLSDFYTSLGPLSAIFPIIILDGISHQYLDKTENKTWDEIWFLEESIQQSGFTELCHQGHHVVELGSNDSEEANFKLNQAPPSKLKNIVRQDHYSEIISSIKPFASFILQNFDQILISLNHEELVISFIPEHLHGQILIISGKKWNTFSLSKEEGQDRLIELLIHQKTQKTIWVLDELFDSTKASILELEWQIHLKRIFEVAGFNWVSFQTHQIAHWKDYMMFETENMEFNKELNLLFIE